LPVAFVTVPAASAHGDDDGRGVDVKTPSVKTEGVFPGREESRDANVNGAPDYRPAALYALR
jgi:hypothetical protein